MVSESQVTALRRVARIAGLAGIAAMLVSWAIWSLIVALIPVSLYMSWVGKALTYLGTVLTNGVPVVGGGLVAFWIGVGALVRPAEPPLTPP